jgi:hypothetical protein
VRLGVLVIGLAAVVWYQFGPTAPAAPASNPQVPAAAPVTPVKLPAPVKLAELDFLPEPAEVGRNPFGFGARPAPPAPVAAPMAPALPATPPVPQGPPPIVLRLTALIVIPGSGRTMITLKDPGTGALFQAFEGDVVDGRYRVVKVGNQSVVLSYVDGSGARTVTLGS